MKKCTVTAASNMSGETYEYLCNKIKMRFGDDFEFTRITDDDIIGGCIIDMGGHIFDLSVKTQLSLLKKQFGEAVGD